VLCHGRLLAFQDNVLYILHLRRRRMQYTLSKRWHQSTRLHGVMSWNQTIRTVSLVMTYVCYVHFNSSICAFLPFLRGSGGYREKLSTNHLQLLVTVAHIRSPQSPGPRWWGGGKRTGYRHLLWAFRTESCSSDKRHWARFLLRRLAVRPPF